MNPKDAAHSPRSAHPQREREYLTDEEVPLPVHFLLMQDVPQSPLDDRQRPAAAARATRYECAPFYKYISRPLPRSTPKEDEDECP